MNEPLPTRRATPRPTFTGPAVLRRAAVAHHVWGDSRSGLVTDRVYVSSDTLHSLEFELSPGGEFRHSPTNKTIFAADVAYCVLEGTLVIADPQHGEVQVVRAGEQVLFRRDTWHHGFNPGQETLRVLEFFAPPPSRGTASGYAVRQPGLDESRYQDLRWAHRWPEAAAEQRTTRRLHVCRESEALWGFAADSPSHLRGCLVDTEHLCVVTGRVFAGHVEDHRKVEDESLLVVTGGELWADVQDEPTGEFTAACLGPGDAVFVPANSLLRLLVRSSAQATYLMGSGRPVPAGWTP
jgi:mannose-6-phosphate isomerase-like protein (cupin superfamily)